jgi:hypothetical protein
MKPKIVTVAIFVGTLGISAPSIFSKQETEHDLDCCSDGDWPTTLVSLAQVLGDNLSRNCFTDSY